MSEKEKIKIDEEMKPELKIIKNKESKQSDTNIEAIRKKHV